MLDLSAVNTQLNSMKRQWDNERQELLGENAALQDATKRLNSEVRSAKDAVKRYAEGEKAEKRHQVVTRTVSVFPLSPCAISAVTERCF